MENMNDPGDGSRRINTVTIPDEMHTYYLSY